MATPITGAISMDDVRTVLGSTGAISFNDTLYRQLTNQFTGATTLGNALAAASINTTTTNVNAITGLFGSSAIATAYKILVRSGVSVGATSGNTAFTLGQFPTGSTIVINNYGSILAVGGAAGSSGAGGSGGDAINANYANQTTTINNQTGALIYGGGGGGGKGGNGGTGGTGGGGYYTSNVILGRMYSFALGPAAAPGCGCAVYFGVPSAECNGACNAQPYGKDNPGAFICQGDCYYSATTYTSGGSGGGGGAGGSGGRGQGYDGANAAGSVGSSGSGGAAGGTNAGAGGTGGTGGTGGSGAVYGSAGASGATGNTGGTGASGNNGAGSGGSAGAGGSSGGVTGRYLVKGANSVTLNNSGTVAGSLA